MEGKLNRRSLALFILIIGILFFIETAYELHNSVASSSSITSYTRGALERHIARLKKPVVVAPRVFDLTTQARHIITKQHNESTIYPIFESEPGLMAMTIRYEAPITAWYRESLQYEIRQKTIGERKNACVPMHEWQTSSYPSCNVVHEINMDPDSTTGNFQFINCGSARCAFALKGFSTEYNNLFEEEVLVLKTQKYSKDYSSSNFEAARMDGVVMERLTSSPYITSIFGFCGTSQLTEYSEGGNIHDRVKEARMKDRGERPKDLNVFGDSKNKLKIAIQVISAVADLHTFEKDGITSIVHQDVCCHQIIYVNGVYKLGDFHLSTLLKKRKDTGEVCPEVGTMHAKLRAPEEFVSYANDYKPINLVPADVYMAGNVMYYVLTHQWLFEGHSRESGKAAVVRGVRSLFPTEIANSVDPYTRITIEGIKMCWTHDPKERPSARKIADFMKNKLARLEGVSELGIVTVKMPSLPADHRYTDTDFYSNF